MHEMGVLALTVTRPTWYCPSTVNLSTGDLKQQLRSLWLDGRLRRVYWANEQPVDTRSQVCLLGRAPGDQKTVISYIE